MANLKVLIVEDQETKANHIVDAIRSDSHGKDADIIVAPSGIDARRQMNTTRFDILILDVVLPNRLGDAPQTEGGIELLKEVMSRDSLLRPGYVLGLTAYPEIFQEKAAKFADYTWAIVQYEQGALDWAGPIFQLLKHATYSVRDSDTTANNFDFDVCLVTALNNPEFAALMNLDTKWEECELAGDPATYRVCEIDTEMGPVRIAAGCVDKMGSVAAATFATNMIHQCRPRLLAMAGICAGVRGEVNIGDAVAADISWDYQSGKETVDGFEPAPHQIPLNSALRRRLLALRDKTELFREIKGRWPGERPDTEVQFVIGPFASGSAVIADKADLEKPILQHRKMVALDMETYGIYAAATDANYPPPHVLSIKGVSDYADESKDDRFRAYAAYISAETLNQFIKLEYPGLRAFWETPR